MRWVGVAWFIVCLTLSCTSDLPALTFCNEVSLLKEKFKIVLVHLVHPLLSIHYLEKPAWCVENLSLEMDQKSESGLDLLYNPWKDPGMLVLKVKRWLLAPQ